MGIVICAVFSYVYGAIPYAYIATYLLKHKKLTEEGTGNVGVTNAYKVGGVGAVLITISGEISKALVPIYIAKTFFAGTLFVTLLLVFCSLVGTSFSVFLKGRGGKGSTVAFWSILVLSPYSFLILLSTWLTLSLCARNNLLLKKIQLLCIPCAIFIVERDVLFTAFGVLTSLLFYLNNYARKDDFAYYNIFQQRSGIKDAGSIHH